MALLKHMSLMQWVLAVAALAHSALDAKARRDDPAALPDIHPRTIDLKPFDTVWLGSPFWF